MIDFNQVASLYISGNEVSELWLNGNKVWQKSRGFALTAEEANSTIAMQRVNNAPSVSLEYSTDNGATWSDFTVESTVITLANIGDQALMRAKTTNS